MPERCKVAGNFLLGMKSRTAVQSTAGPVKKVSLVSQNSSLSWHCLPVLFLIANGTKILTYFGYVEYYGLLQQRLKNCVVIHLETYWTRLSKMASELGVSGGGVSREVGRFQWT